MGNSTETYVASSRENYSKEFFRYQSTCPSDGVKGSTPDRTWPVENQKVLKIAAKEVANLVKYNRRALEYE